jgi:hypothetical protein
VQYLGPFALQPRSLARGHNRYCETCRFHARYLLTAESPWPKTPVVIALADVFKVLDED